MATGCSILAERIVEALDEQRSGAVRAAVAAHAASCAACATRADLSILARELDPELPTPRPGFIHRVMAELRPERTAYDRLPPLWLVFGAGALFVALAAVVLATGGAGAAWHERALTGFLDQSLVFLGSLSKGIRGLWDAVVPGRGLPILIGCAVAATILNVGIAISVIRRKKRTVE